MSRLRTRYRAGSATVELPRSGDSHCDVAVSLMAAVGEHDRHPLGNSDGATVGGRSSGLISALHSDPWPLLADGRLTTARYGDRF